MTEEIKKLIDKEAHNYHSELARAEIDNFEYEGNVTTNEAESCVRTAEIEGFKVGAFFILSKWQEAERWRKVGEHRPAVDEHLMYSYTCLVRLESGAYAIAVYHLCGAWMESGTEEYLDTVIEWKPIS